MFLTVSMMCHRSDVGQGNFPIIGYSRISLYVTARVGSPQPPNEQTYGRIPAGNIPTRMKIIVLSCLYRKICPKYGVDNATNW